MLYVQQFQNNRQNHLTEFRSLRSSTGQNFLLCSNEYVEKVSRPVTRATTPNVQPERTPTLLLLTRIQSLVSLNNNSQNDLSILNIQPGIISALNTLPNDVLEVQGQRVRTQPDSFWSYYPGDVGILCKKSSNWNPQRSRITRENKDYMTALAKGLTRVDGKQFESESSEVFSARWHHHLANSVYRPGTGKMGSKRSRPPSSVPERGKMVSTSHIEFNRPTTAPVTIEQRPRRSTPTKIKSAAPIRSRASPGPVRAARVIDSSGNFDNLTNSTFLQLTDGLKSSIYSNNNHFVHQICSNASDTLTELTSTNRDNYSEISTGTLLTETYNGKQDNDEINENKDDDNNNDFQPVVNLVTWERDSKSGRIEVVANAPDRKPVTQDPNEIEKRIVEQEEEALRQREKDIEQYTFDLPTDSLTPNYDYKNPFPEEYDQAILFQSQISTTFPNNEWNLKDFYQNVETKLDDDDSNTKAVFEKCIKLARLQTNTIKWEQRRRQNFNLYNRLMRCNALDGSTSNLTGSISSKTTINTDKDMKELNDLKRELRCSECKRISCLGNCAPGQDYHLYKRIISSIPPQTYPSKQSSIRDKHGCTTCSSNHSRTTADVINANAIIKSLNNNNNNNTNNAVNSVRASKATFSYGQKSQRPTVDLRPRSMNQVTREMKMKFEQVNLSPVVVVPLFETESQTMMNKRPQRRSTNGLLPGKSFRSQRRDSLTLVAVPKVTS